MERRGALRVTMTDASVQVMCLGRWTHAGLTDLSMRGAQVAGDDLPSRGTRVRLQLSLDGHAVRLESVMTWHDSSERSGGMAFEPLSTAQRWTLADVLMHAGHRDVRARHTVLLAINGSPRFSEVAGAIRRHGFGLNVAPTPLDALRRIESEPHTLCAAIVSRAPVQPSGDHLLEVLAVDYPEIHRVLLLEDADPATALDAHSADRVLLWPWAHDDLEAMFELFGT